MSPVREEGATLDGQGSIRLFSEIRAAADRRISPARAT